MVNTDEYIKTAYRNNKSSTMNCNHVINY